MNENNNNNNNGGNEKKNRDNNILRFMFSLFLAFLIFGIFNNYMNRRSSDVDLTYDKFIEMVEAGEIKEVVLQDNELTITPKKMPASGAVEYKTNMIGDENALLELLTDKGVTFNKKSPDPVMSVLSTILGIALPFIILMVFFSFLMRRSGGGGLMNVGKSKAKAYVQKDTGVTFEDVAGEDEAKESLQEMVEFLHHPERFNQIGAKLPKGALLVGPPGTGKTLLAKAVAGEAHVPFFSLSGSEFVEMFVGVGASRVRDLFEEAKKQSPCIIFIDEIDAIGKSRDSRFGGNDEREQTLNQLLAEMDGFDSDKGILILAATNRPEILDPALLRPGRFDRRVIVERPDLRGRVEILKVHAKKVRLDETVDLNEIALATSGAVGSDLANMVNEAAILAVKHNRKAVSQKDLFEAVEVVLVGKEKKDRILSQEERKIVSYHEVGHALLTALQKDAEPVQKITIVPRTMGALGYVMQVPEEEKYLNTKTELEAILVSTLGGRAAEEIVFGNVTTGASNDIEKATKLCRAMITQYGMSEKFGLMSLESQENKYLDGRSYLTCGDSTATEIDHEIMEMLKNAYEEAKRLLSENRDALDEIADYLIRKETITGAEFMDIFHEVIKKRTQPDEIIYLGTSEKAEVPAESREEETAPEENSASVASTDAGIPEETAADPEQNIVNDTEQSGEEQQ
ncbi:MAG: ATP-dependent zinc metalloprotease FtsH [Lachnospiraceae bacterium]|nr:ATP-dependent zinc metalloprotease FtsH [Lachnospiraceae bacterium]